MRKGSLLLITVCCIISHSGHAKLQRYTADFYKVRSVEYLNKPVRLYAFSARLADPAPFRKAGYTLVKVKTIYNDQHGGDLLIAVPTDAVIAFKDKYSVLLEDAVKLSGTLRRSTGEEKVLFLEYGDGPSTQQSIELRKKKKQSGPNKTAQYSIDYYELQAEKYIGRKITLPVTSAELDRTSRLDHIKNTRAFIVETTNQKIRDGRMAVVVPHTQVSHFARIFMTNTENEPRNLSGYLYKCKTEKTAFLYLYCSREPLQPDLRKTPSPQDDLYDLVSIYMDLEHEEKEQLIDLARKLDSTQEADTYASQL